MIYASEIVEKLNRPNMSASKPIFTIASLFAIVLIVCNLFHPFNVLAVDCSRNGNMRHCRIG
jgi:hypothetical protein